MPTSSNEARVTPFHEQILKTALVATDRTSAEWMNVEHRRGELWAPEARQLLPLLARALVDAHMTTRSFPG